MTGIEVQFSLPRLYWASFGPSYYRLLLAYQYFVSCTSDCVYNPTCTVTCINHGGGLFTTLDIIWKLWTISH